MPKWLQGMVVPTLLLWSYALAMGVASGAMQRGPLLPWSANWASSVACSLVMANWLLADARKLQRKLCYDYDTFVYFAWPILLPIYLFQTRGARAILTLLSFAGISLVSWLVGRLTSMLLR